MNNMGHEPLGFQYSRLHVSSGLLTREFLPVDSPEWNRIDPRGAQFRTPKLFALLVSSWNESTSLWRYWPDVTEGK